MALTPYHTDDHTCTGVHDPAYPDCLYAYEGPPDFKPYPKPHTALPAGYRVIERCGQLSSFNDDEEAAKAAGYEGVWIKCPNGGQHYIVEEQEAKLCPNCDCAPRCGGQVFCDGCDMTLCVRCWAEHNEDAPCHYDNNREEAKSHPIKRMFEQEGHRLKAVLEKLNEAGAFGGEVIEADEGWGYNLYCKTWDAMASFTDAYDYDGDVTEPGQMANVTVFCAREGGQILPSFVPYNYSPIVWCDLRDEGGRSELIRRLSNLEEGVEEFAAAIKRDLPDEDGVVFSEMGQDGELRNVRVIRQSDIAACPHAIMVPAHYRDDGSCKCDDPDEQAKMIREWGYTPDNFKKGGQA